MSGPDPLPESPGAASAPDTPACPGPAVEPTAPAPAINGSAPAFSGTLAIPEQLSWFLILLPGFVLVSVMSVVTERPEWSELEFTAYSLIGSVLCFGLTVTVLALGRALFRLMRRKARAPSRSGGYSLPASFVLLNFLLAAALGGLIGVALENDASVKTLNQVLGLNLDKRSWMRPLKYVLQHNHFGRMQALEADGRSPALRQAKVYVRIGIKDGPTYEGWPYFLPHGNAKTELFLSPACKQEEKETRFVLIQGPGVLVPLDEYQSVELVDRAGSSCFAQIKAQAICASCAECARTAAYMGLEAATAACRWCGIESEGFVMSALTPVKDRQHAELTAKACQLFADCRDEPTSPACREKEACLTAAREVSTLTSCRQPQDKP